MIDCSITYLEDHNILLTNWQTVNGNVLINNAYAKVDEMIKENHIGKLIIDYQLVDLIISPDNLKQMLTTLRSFSSDDIYKAFVTDEPVLLEETIQNHLMKDTTNTPISQTSLKYRIFQDLSLALDWLKSI